ncbi:MAG: pyridoxamine 5'-phosphate oxidase family protein [Gammaproteobacteria bacterium]|nr:pyridoxamine 5'-phosphate oxidase family protein [Gammaproteobacteria bacterium]
MAQQYIELSDSMQEFISRQKIFFVGTATADSKVNISPKGMDSFRVLDKSRIVWLNLTGSGNETSAHVQVNPRMTVMFMALEGKPMILRLYGQARVVHKNDKEWETLISMFPSIPAARQIFDLRLELVQTSCGMAVPYFEYIEDREQLNDLHRKIGNESVTKYWKEKNQYSIDGIPTDIVARNCKPNTK